MAVPLCLAALGATASPAVSGTLTVSKSGDGSGIVVSTNGGIDCGSDCTESLGAGRGVVLHAAAELGSIFTGWSGACTGRRALCELSLSTDKAVTAYFDRASCHPAAATPQGYPAGTSPRAVALGDVNRDGRTDIVVANRDSNDVTLLLAERSGGFRSDTPPLRVSPGPTGVVVADFSGDGRPDIATISASPEAYLSLLRGTRDGFEPMDRIGTGGSEPSALAAADLDRDGGQDAVVTNEGSDRVSVLWGHRGRLWFARSIAVEDRPVAVAVADLNRDGRKDLVVANAGANTLSILLASGGWLHYSPARSVPTGATPVHVAVADFDRDGAMDLAVANRGDGTVSIARGTHPGAFTSARPYSVGGMPTAVEAADVNGDGVLDVVATDAASGTVALLAGTGIGTFLPAVPIRVGGAPSAVAVGDLDGRGRPEIAVANVADGGVAVLSGCDLSCSPWINTRPYMRATSGQALGKVTSGDLNGDGWPDIIVAGARLNKVVVVQGGTLNFTESRPISAGRFPFGVASGDFDGDGKTDLIATNYNDAQVSVVTAQGVARPHPVDGEPTSVVVGDINRDGRLDAVVSSFAGGRLNVLLGNGDGGLTPSSRPFVFGASDVALADFNRDGWLDLAGTSVFLNDVLIHLNRGAADDGRWLGFDEYAYNGNSVGGSPEDVTVADFDRDGILDLAVANHATGDVSVLLGRGDGTFHPSRPYDVGDRPVSVEAHDLNQDGWSDLIVAVQGSGTAGSAGIVVRLGNQYGSFDDAEPFPYGVNPRSLTLADFDRDGCVDIGLAETSRTLSILKTACPRPSHRLNVTISGEGTVSSDHGGTCSSECGYAVPDGTRVTLTAEPTCGWAFAGWGGACRDLVNCVVTMTVIRSVTATFEPIVPPPSCGS